MTINDMYGDLTDPNDPDLAPWTSAEATATEKLEHQILKLQEQLAEAKAAPETPEPKPEPPVSEHEAVVKATAAIDLNQTPDQFYGQLHEVERQSAPAPTSEPAKQLTPEEIQKAVDKASAEATDTADLYARLAQIPGAVDTSSGRSY